MGTLRAPEGLCAGVIAVPIVSGYETATRIEWDVIDKPAGSQVIFSDDTSAESTIDVSADGAYTIQLRCYFEEGVVAPPAPVAPNLACPISVIAGNVATVILTGCQDATIEWSASGVATGISGDSVQVGGKANATVTTFQEGTATVVAICRITDADGVETVTQFTCGFEVLAADTELACITSAPVSFSFVSCGESCQTSEAIFVFNCEENSCLSAQIGLVFKDCPPCEDPEECEPLERLEMLGVERASLTPCEDFIDFGCDVVCCDPHKPVLFWNNLFSCPGWVFEGAASEGSSVYNAAGCNPGQMWCTDGTATLVASGPAILVDTMIIWGHNIVAGSVTTSPLKQFGGAPADISLVGDDACIQGYTVPIVINFADVPESITDFTATIASADGGPFCIDQIFIGQKLFLPDDRLPLSFQNPHNGTDYRLEVTSSECGPLSRSLIHTPVPMALDVECVSEEYMCEKWRPYLRYAQRHGVLFQWSRNRKPNDIFSGWITGPAGPSSYSSPHEQTVTLQAEGYITQTQSKVLV